MVDVIMGRLALVLTLLATGGLIVYIISQNKRAYLWSYRILLAGFVCLTVRIFLQYYATGAAPVLTLKSATHRTAGPLPTSASPHRKAGATGIRESVRKKPSGTRW